MLINNSNEFLNDLSNSGYGIFNNLGKLGGSGDSLDDASFSQGLKNLFTGNLDYQRNIAETEKSRAWSEYATKMQYQWNKEGMESIGLNPYLMYGSNSGVVSGPTSAYSKSSGSGFQILGNLMLSLLKMSISSSINSSLANSNMQKAIANQNLANAINQKHINVNSAYRSLKKND